MSDRNEDLFRLKAAEIVSALTTPQKGELSTGASSWSTADLSEAHLPPIAVADGPHGLRIQHVEGDFLGAHEAAPATCFPPAVALASTWNIDLVASTADAIAQEAIASGVSVVLGPGVNIKRSIRCGRNFEYFSEDPVLSGALGAAWVRGMQSRGVGASLKHFAANNQETERMRISAEIDERALHEVYLRAFRHIVRTEQPWTVMCAYNAINGVFAAENRWLLSDLLRDEWGFQGLVVSDWGAVHDRVEALRAGLDLEMPSTGGKSAREVVSAIESGALSMDELDRSATRVAELILRSIPHIRQESYDQGAHHALAQDVATEAIVLLKNDRNALPLDADTATSVAVIGELARSPRYQGAGSSKIVPTQVDDPLSRISLRLPADVLRFAAGYRIDGVPDDSLLREAVELATVSDHVIVFVGLPDADESEGYDREHIELPLAQTRLIEALLDAGAEVVVVLSNGSAVRVAEWSGRVAGLVEGWLLGQGGGEAIARVLLGEANPSGRLAETIPERIEDTPDFLDFPGDELTVQYGEGIFVGYRWYDARKLDVSFPFGFGLSYTTFEYSELAVAVEQDSGVRVTLNVSNTGNRDGAEVVQVYAGRLQSDVTRPVRELKGFAKCFVPAGETRRVDVEIQIDEFDFYSVRDHAWRREAGEYSISVGSSSRHILGEAIIHLEGKGAHRVLTLDSTVGEWLAHPDVGGSIQAILDDVGIEPGSTRYRQAHQTPMRGAISFASEHVSLEDVEGLIEVANRA